ncbi:MAG: TspO/MBR family protein [Halanaerobiales bacterium]
MKKIKNLIICLTIPLVTGLLSGYLTADEVKIYDELVLPAFAPPGWVFGPAWIFLYLMMGYASYRIWKKRYNYNVKNSLSYYGIQLIFNFFWTIIFFGLGLRGFAFLEILILLILIIVTTIKFYDIDKISAYMMFPYIIWVSFAAVLNYSIWILNI